MINIGDKSLDNIGCYAPTNCSPNFLEKEAFYKQVNAVLRDTKCKCGSIITVGNFNCRPDWDDLVNHMNLLGLFTDSMETTENKIHLLSFYESDNL